VSQKPQSDAAGCDKIFFKGQTTLKTSFLATVSGLTLTAVTAALGADIPTKAPPAPAANWNWSGPYVGLNLGAGQHSSSFYDLGDPTCCQLAFTTQNAFWSPDNWGATIGGQAGYNWQFGNVVAGVEADINWIDGKSSTTIASSFGGTPVSATADMDWFATARGRLGLAFSRTLIYATGGWAAARGSDGWGFVGATPRFSFQDTRSAGVVGGGIEYMLTQNWTVRVEGLHSNFGTSPITTISGFGGHYQSKFTDSLTVVRGALNWKW